MATRHSSAVVTLPSDTTILITRSFEAPRALVWEVITTPRHILRWWGPDWCPIVSCEIDLHPGGSWRYVSRDADGNELGWHGTYREVEPPHRLVSTEVFEGFPDAVAVNTVTLAESNGVTTLQTLVEHTSREHRDGHVQSGMEAGMQLTYNRLDDLLDIAGTAAERFRRVAGRFSERVAEVDASPSTWENVAPCAGWKARDIVRHLVEWIPSVIGRGGVAFSATSSVDHDPAGAWGELSASLQSALDDPAIARHTFDVGPPGEMTVEQAIDRLVVGDVLVHTWDLARATGLDETIDEGIASEMLGGLQAIDEMLRSSGHYGPKVVVAANADAQTQLIAFTGRDPAWRRP